MENTLWTFIFFITLVSLAAAADESLKFYCYQAPGQATNHYKTSYVTCPQEGKDTKPNVVEKKNICVVNAMCAADSPDLRAKIMKQASNDANTATDFKDLSINDIQKYLRFIDINKAGSDMLSIQKLVVDPRDDNKSVAILPDWLIRPTLLTCPAKDDSGNCPTPSDCIGDGFYNNDTIVTHAPTMSVHTQPISATPTRK